MTENSEKERQTNVNAFDEVFQEILRFSPSALFQTLKVVLGCGWRGDTRLVTAVSTQNWVGILSPFKFIGASFGALAAVEWIISSLYHHKFVAIESFSYFNPVIIPEVAWQFLAAPVIYILLKFNKKEFLTWRDFADGTIKNLQILAYGLGSFVFVFVPLAVGISSTGFKHLAKLELILSGAGLLLAILILCSMLIVNLPRAFAELYNVSISRARAVIIGTPFILSYFYYLVTK